MTLRLHNTLTRQVEPFVPLHPGRVSLYTCGPTIYNYAHIGNFRTFLFEDLLRRWLEASGLEVFHIMNLTDVDNRTIAAAAAKGVSLRQHVDPFARAFEEDRDWLRIRPAHAQPRATEYIAPMIELVQGLLDRGVAYQAEDRSVYFSIARFPSYGRLSRLDRRELRTGASQRVSADEYAKEDAADFALWKAAESADEAVGAAWDAPFGRGRPGWHIECSAMALELIRRKWGVDVLDIHAGAVDLIFPHHEDEIAQSCAYTGKDEFARVWVHGEFLDLDGTKMSKRYGNILTARDLRERIAECVRHRGGPGLEFLEGFGVAGAVTLRHAVGPHRPPFVMIPFEPDFEEVVEPAVDGDVPRREMAMEVTDGFGFRELVIQPPRRAAAEKKIVVDEAQGSLVSCWPEHSPEPGCPPRGSSNRPPHRSR
jgi:cysteinyl-tRNA synthetase